MPKIEVPGFDETPTKFELVPSGVYDLLVVEMPELVAQKKDPTKKSLKLTFEVNDGEFKGRRIWERVPMSRRTDLKRLALAAGIETADDGFDSDDLYDRVVKAAVGEDSYKNDMGVVVETNRVKRYLLEEDTVATSD